MNRIGWIDYSRAVGCLLVAIGHLFMSLVDANIMNNYVGINFFINSIYHFHVYIFFFCSGFLFQKTFKKCNDNKEIRKKKLVRTIDIFIPYMFFSGITYFIKVVLSNAVNNAVSDSFVKVLLVEPINQMWFLYVLLIITIVTPVIKNDKVMHFMIFSSVLIKLCNILFIKSFMPFVSYFFANEIWFIIGMIYEYRKRTITTRNVTICTVVFTVGTVICYFCNIDSKWIDTLLTFTGMLSIIGIFQYIFSVKEEFNNKFLNYLSSYMLPIYLMHTICAAGIRIILIRIGIQSCIVHLAFGLFFSFIVPIIIAIIMEKSCVFNFFVYPNKTIKQLKKRIQQ